MHAFGDESGHLRSVLRDGGTFTQAVVAGDTSKSGACPKRAVRNIRNIKEAKWNEFDEVRKRRFCDCLKEYDDLAIGYVVITGSDLQELDRSYMLYQDDNYLSVDWDISMMAHAYAELLNQIIPDQGQPVSFHFDRIFTPGESKKLGSLVENKTDDVAASHNQSTQMKGIQAADCVAGAAREDTHDGTEWIERIASDRNSEPIEATDFALARFEGYLHSGKTAP